MTIQGPANIARHIGGDAAGELIQDAPPLILPTLLAPTTSARPMGRHLGRQRCNRQAAPLAAVPLLVPLLRLLASVCLQPEPQGGHLRPALRLIGASLPVSATATVGPVEPPDGAAVEPWAKVAVADAVEDLRSVATEDPRRVAEEGPRRGAAEGSQEEEEDPRSQAVDHLVVGLRIQGMGPLGRLARARLEVPGLRVPSHRKGWIF